MDQVIAAVQQLFPTAVTGGGLFGIYVYFRKVDQAIKDDLRSTIKQQAEQIEKLWTECRNLRDELSGKKSKREPDEDGDSK